ncbi:FKBP-type peptidyl-prolyl cis-trans isomerase [Allosphingosinicella flava]|uniref:Peptidyl-prolyl cis-trans isomerase n=1 Tax=Allosphingosinicella flava TaxID=2771430 RepID=A0A7T2GIB7_9SPHN|nr:FKBP-type peptidyl-prolyl cis-trans isomerase [Sphingosinicella flava]QPQ54402.1 FKBP-type peptidyl-prolyl cis-trans isomerase [Sphingosinicella flava]
MSVTAVPIRPLKKGSVVRLWAGIAILCAAGAGLAYVGTEGQRAADPASFLADNAEEDGVVTTASGLQYKVLQQGAGPRPGETDMVAVDYEGRIPGGKVFDTSAGRGPATFPVVGVVPGFSEALQLMQRGATYRIWLSPELGYGAEEQRDPQTGEVVIPANAVLEFDLTLRDFQPIPPEQLQQLQAMRQMQQQMEAQQGGAKAE